MIFQMWYRLILYFFAKKQLHETTAESHQRGKQNTFFSNEKNLSQRSFSNQAVQWGDKASGEAIEIVQVQAERVSEKIQGKDAQAASETTVFT